MSRFLKKLRSKKGLTGADVASAITVILLTIGVVTAIYVNAINKSKDNLRYANAVRIATNIIENIQANPYDYMVAICGASNKAEVIGNGEKIFETKIPNGFSATVTLSTAKEPDIVRDVTVNVKYKSSMTHKTITLKTVKEKELMDNCNKPDLSMLLYDTGEQYVYPVIPTGTKYKITTSDDIKWYNYDNKNFAYALATSDANLGLGAEKSESADNIYIWVPRFVKNKNAPSTGYPKIQYLYGTSNYKIVFNTGNFNYYGIILGGDNKPIAYDTEKYDKYEDFEGKSGVWVKGTELSSSVVYNTLFNNL